MRLTNRTAVVTGAASGIGWATAVAFLHHGAKVALLDENTEKAQAQLKAIPDISKNAQVIMVDVRDPLSVNAAVEESESRFGDTQILVNCAAALTPAKTVEHLALEDWNNAFAVNVTGAYLMSKAALPRMRAGGGGSIIHVASQLGTVAIPGYSAYCATKGALLQLARTMAIDHADDNIRVNSLSPGATLTERLKTRYGTDDAASEALAGGYPLGRLGRAEEIANGAVFLASDESSFVTGTDLVIDGGYLAQ